MPFIRGLMVCCRCLEWIWYNQDLLILSSNKILCRGSARMAQFQIRNGYLMSMISTKQPALDLLSVWVLLNHSKVLTNDTNEQSSENQNSPVLFVIFLVVNTFYTINWSDDVVFYARRTLMVFWMLTDSVWKFRARNIEDVSVNI